MSITSDYRTIRDGSEIMSRDVPHEELALYLSAAYAFMAALGVLEDFLKWSRDMEIGVAMIEESER